MSLLHFSCQVEEESDQQYKSLELPQIIEDTDSQTILSPLSNQEVQVFRTATTIPYLTYDSPTNENGSFEQSRLFGGIQGWEIESTAALRWRQSSNNMLSGDFAMIIESTGALSNENVEQFTRLVSDTISVTSGDLIKFSAWLYADGSADKVPEIFVEAQLEPGWERLEPYPHRNEITAHQWVPLSKTVIVPEGVRHIRLVAQADTAMVSNNNAWYIDDFYCEVVSLKDYVAKNRTQPRLKDILLYGMDTLRQSPLSCYGSETVHTPNMDLVAEDGIAFRHVITNSPWTRPSFASIFTSLYPSQHTAELHNSILPDSVTTLAELLQAHGYFTVAFVKSPFDGFVGPGAGYAKGFDAFFYTPGDENIISDAFDEFLVLNAEALSNLEGGGIFIFRHFWDFHDTYINHYPDRIQNMGLLGDVTLDSHTLWSKLYPMQTGVVNDADVDFAVAVYESQAQYVDNIIGRTFSRLKQYGLFDEMNIVICSDHGESFNEKEGVWYHGNPYITSTEVPLILRFPGYISPGQFDHSILASNLDIMPTLLALTGIPVPEHLEGLNLLAMENVPEDRICVSEDRKMGSITIRDRQYKLVAIPASLPTVNHRDPYEYWLSLQPGTIRQHMDIRELEFNRDWVLGMPDSPTKYELYDLKNDPFQHHDIAVSQPEQFNRLLEALLQHCLRTGILRYGDIVESGNFDLDDETLLSLKTFAEEQTPSGVHIPGTVELTPETLEQLQAQGYL